MSDERPDTFADPARVLRVHAVSESGAPYELHYPQAKAPRAPADAPCPIEAAQAAVDDLASEHPEWIAGDLAALDAALAEWRPGDPHPTALHQATRLLAGTAQLVGAQRLSLAATTLAERLANGRIGEAAAHDSAAHLRALADGFVGA